MASVAEETDAGIMLAMSAIERLRARNPGHELLQFEDTFAARTPPVSFVERFGGDNIPAVHRDTEFAAAAMFLNFYNALEAAQ
jgi:hypothetical protein